MSDFSERLRTIRAHLSTGALGQREVWEEWLEQAAEEIDRLEHNQMSTGYTTVAQVAAFQAQEADAQRRYSDKVDVKNQQLTEALTKAIGLQDALLTEMGIMQRELGRPPSLQLMAAKHNFDAAMKVLLKDEDESARETESDNHGETR